MINKNSPNEIAADLPLSTSLNIVSILAVYWRPGRHFPAGQPIPQATRNAPQVAFDNKRVLFDGKWLQQSRMVSRSDVVGGYVAASPGSSGTSILGWL